MLFSLSIEGIYFNRRLGQIDQSLISVHTSFTCIASTTDIKLSTHETVSNSSSK